MHCKRSTGFPHLPADATGCHYPSRQEAALEQRVGARLVERTTRRLAPTAAGRTLADQARLLLDGYTDATQAPMDAALRGTLRVTALSCSDAAT
jgi:DNA-binding transcriptional LysR family regulator